MSAAVIAILVVAYLAVKDKRKEEHAADRVEAVAAMPISADQLLAEIESMVSDGRLLKQGAIEVTKFGPDAVTLTYTRSSPTPRMTATEAEVTTVGLATFAVSALVAHGYNPREHQMSIFAHAHQPAGKSVTGAAQVRTFGKAVYDYNTDRVEYGPN